MHMQNANQVAPAALARAGVCTTGMVASKFLIDSEDRARWASSLQMGAGPSFFFFAVTCTRGPRGSMPRSSKPRGGKKQGPSGIGS